MSQTEKKSGNQGPWIRCGHCRKKFRSWMGLNFHWLWYCNLKPAGTPSIIVCSIEDVLKPLTKQEKENA